MRRKESEEDDNSPYLFCESCEQMYERALIAECSFCGKRFCRSCAVRSGSQAFCGRACAKNWFFADEDEGEDTGSGGERGRGEP